MGIIVITGSTGRVGAALRPGLVSAGHRLVLVDRKNPGDAGPGERAVTADVTDLDAMTAACSGADLVVHLAGYAREREWADILAVNVNGTRVVCEAARRAGVGRLLLASSVHAVGFLPTDAPIVGTPAPRPDTYYGVGKAALEALGSLYADRFGMTVISARIMHFADRPGGGSNPDAWFSPGDAVRLAEAALTTRATGHHVVWGVSRSGGRIVDLSPGEAVGYHPVDDAEEWEPSLCHVPVSSSPPVLGGKFTEAEHPVGVDWRAIGR
jgi:nucleoside-diphosphate-sugar epimerase